MTTVGDLDDVLREIELVGLGSVFEEGDAIGRGNDVGVAEVFAKEGVEEGGFAGVHLADDHEKERILKIGEEILEQGEASRIDPALAPEFSERLDGLAQLLPGLEVVFAEMVCRVFGQSVTVVWKWAVESSGQQELNQKRSLSNSGAAIN